MSGWTSPATGRVDGVQRVCAFWSVSRSTFYARKAAGSGVDHPRRGPRPVLSDVQLAERIRETCSETEERWGFRGEGRGGRASRTFDTAEQLRQALQDFRTTYNNNWMLGRWGHRTPATVRHTLTPSKAAA